MSMNYARSWSVQSSYAIDQADVFMRISGQADMGHALAAPVIAQGALFAGSMPGLTNGSLHTLTNTFGGSPLWDGPQLNFGKDTPVKTVSNTTSVGTTGNFTNQDINGLLSGVAWDSLTLTFSFPSAESNYGNHYGDNHAVRGFQPLSEAQEDVVRYAFDLISQYTQLTFTEITETDSTHATLRFAGSSYPSTSYAYYPADSTTGGDAFYGNIRNDDPVKAGYEFDTIMHEIGHTLGLKHGQTPAGGHGVLPTEHNSTEWSIMDYHSYIGADNFYNNEQGSGNQSYMVDDISALQYIYGANFGAYSGNTVYTWSSTTGEMFIDGAGQGASETNTIYEAIWDGNGADTYDLSNYATDMVIDLRPGEWSTFSTEQLPYLDYADHSQHSPGNIDNANLYSNDPRSLIENANGGSGNDRLTGNTAANALNGNGGNDTMDGGDGNDALDGGGGKDKLTGGNGDDWLTGGAGNDALTGGAGADRFTYAAADDSTGALYDTVKKADFAADFWDVSAAVTGIDATIGAGALSKGSFDGDLAFAADAAHLLAGHVVLFTPDSGGLAGKMFLVVDLNGIDGYQADADLVVQLSKVQNLASIDSGDFI